MAAGNITLIYISYNAYMSEFDEFRNNTLRQLKQAVDIGDIYKDTIDIATYAKGKTLEWLMELDTDEEIYQQHAGLGVIPPDFIEGLIGIANKIEFEGYLNGHLKGNNQYLER